MIFCKNEDMPLSKFETEVTQLEKGVKLKGSGKCKNCCKNRKKQLINIEDLYSEFLSNL